MNHRDPRGKLKSGLPPQTRANPQGPMHPRERFLRMPVWGKLVWRREQKRVEGKIVEHPLKASHHEHKKLRELIEIRGRQLLEFRGVCLGKNRILVRVARSIVGKRDKPRGLGQETLRSFLALLRAELMSEVGTDPAFGAAHQPLHHVRDKRQPEQLKMRMLEASPGRWPVILEYLRVPDPGVPIEIADPPL